jgi:hypothetical protein
MALVFVRHGIKTFFFGRLSLQQIKYRFDGNFPFSLFLTDFFNHLLSSPKKSDDVAQLSIAAEVGPTDSFAIQIVYLLVRSVCFKFYFGMKFKYFFPGWLKAERHAFQRSADIHSPTSSITGKWHESKFQT